VEDIGYPKQYQPIGPLKRGLNLSLTGLNSWPEEDILLTFREIVTTLKQVSNEPSIPQLYVYYMLRTNVLKKIPI
jgi:hypothetical protein